MRTIMLFVSLLLFNFSINAQTKKVFKINPGEKPYYVLPKNEMYRYADFTEGTVFMRDGKVANAKLNYNSLFGEMQFIDPKGDTLSLADEGTIASISIKTDTFYYGKEQGCLEMLMRVGQMKLMKKKILYISNKEKIGALGTTNTSGGVETYQYMSNSVFLKDLIVQEITSFSEKISYYIGDRFNYFTELNKKSLFKMYPDHRSDISDHLDKNKTNLNDEEDLKKLCVYLKESGIAK